MNLVPAVSVVLPVWNGERFLVEAVTSVLSQTLENIELLIVDDGSTDATPGLVDDFARSDARVRVIRLGRGGIARALNTGIGEARGRYVARMDADDVALPSRLQKQLAYLDANAGCVAVGSAVQLIDEAGGSVGTNVYPEHHAAIAHMMTHTWMTAMAHPTVVARRDALLAVGGYRAHREPSEDLDLWFRLSAIGELANLREQLLRYRRHGDTISVRDRKRQWEMCGVIVNEARTAQGLQPLVPRVEGAGRSHLAYYHFECARSALLTGPRRAAIHHTRATIASEPFWPRPYLALLACAFPKWTLRGLLGLSARFQSLLTS